MIVNGTVTARGLHKNCLLYSLNVPHLQININILKYQNIWANQELLKRGDYLTGSR